MTQIKWHRPIRQGVVTALAQVFNQGHHVDRVVYFALKDNKKWGSRDRRQFAEAVYDITRWYRKLWILIGEKWPAQDEIPVCSEDQIYRLLDLWSEKSGDVADLKTGAGRATDQSIPDWLDKVGADELGAKWDLVLPELNRIAPVFLRVNALKTTVAQVLKALESEGYKAEAVPETSSAIRLLVRANVFRSKAYADGLFEVQDFNSQKIAPFLQVEPGHRVIDACAGSGGKALHLASLMKDKGKIVSLDISERKLDELKKRSRRAGVSIIEMKTIDSTKVIKRLEGSADRLLLDVPCSGLGALRRHPDSKWRMKPDDLPKVQETQTVILHGYSQMLKADGILVYATCSILPSENQKQVQSFLSQNKNQWCLEEEQSYSPTRNGGDGFYMAKLRRLKAGPEIN